MLNKKELIKTVLYLSLFITLFSLITFILYQVQEKVNSLEYKVIALLEKELNSRVKIGQVEGDFTKQVILKDVTIYHEFRKNLKLVTAKRVELHFDLINAIFKEKIPEKNLRKIVVTDFDLYLDEDFGHLKVIRIIEGTDDGIPGNIHDLAVVLRQGRVHTQFKNVEDYGWFRLEDVNGLVRKYEKSISYNGTGFFTGSKIYGNTQSRFEITGDDSIKKANVKGVLNLDNLSYLGYHFRGVGLDYMITNEKVLFRLTPTSHMPFYNSLPDKYKKSYQSDKPFNYLLDLKFEFLIKEEDLYVDIQVNQQSEAVVAIFQNFLKDNPLPFIKKITKIDKKLLNQVDKMRPGQETDIFNQEKPLKKYYRIGQPYGTAKFKISRGGKMTYLLKGDVNTILQKDDHLAFHILGNRQGLSLKNIWYEGSAGTVKGSGRVKTTGEIENMKLEVNDLSLPAFFWDIPKDSWKFNQKKESQKIDLATMSLTKKPLEDINFNKSRISANLVFSKKTIKEVDEYQFSSINNKFDSHALPDIDGTISLALSHVYLSLLGTNQIHFRLQADTDIEESKFFNFNLKLIDLDYSVVENLLGLNYDFNNLTFDAELEGTVDLKNMQGSSGKGNIKIFSPNDTILKSKKSKETTNRLAKKNQTLLNNPGLNNKLDLSLPIDIKPLPSIDYRYRKETANLNVKYKNGLVYFNDSAITGKDIKFDAIVAFANGYIYPELTLYYSGKPFYFDGFFSKTKKGYHTKLNVIYDNFERQFTSITGYLQPQKNGFKLKDFIARHHQSNYNLSGYFGWEDNKIITDLTLLSEKNNKTNPFNPQTKYQLKGNLAIHHFDKAIRLDPHFDIQLKNTPIALDGTILIDGDNITPRLNMKYDKDNVGLGGLIILNESGFNSELAVLYNQNKFDLSASVSQKKGILYTILSLRDEENYITLNGVTRQDEKKHYHSKISLGVNEEQAIIRGKFYTQGSTFLSDFQIEYENQKIDINGYVTYLDKYYFPYFNADFYPSKDNKAESIPFRLEGKIVDKDSYFDINTVINKRLNISGQYKKYSRLNLKLFFDNYKISLDKEKSITIDNKHNEEGVLVKITPKGIKSIGDLVLKEMSFIPGKGFEFETNFSYDFPFDKKKRKNINQVKFNSFVLRRNDKSVLVSKGDLRYSKNNWSLKLQDKDNTSDLQINYNPKSQTIDSQFKFNKMSIKNFARYLKGNISGQIEIKGDIKNPKIDASNVKIEGNYNEQPLKVGDLDLRKTDRKIFITKGNIQFGDLNIGQITNLTYKIPVKLENINDYFTELQPKSTIDIDALTITYKTITVSLEKIKYLVGNEKVPLLSLTPKEYVMAKFEEKEKANIILKNNQGTQIKIKKTPFSLYQFFTNPNSRFSFEKGQVTIQTLKFSKLTINRFSYFTGDNWFLDTDMTLKLEKVLGNNYYTELHLFGGRKENYAEFNIQGNHFQINDKKYANFEIIAEAEKEKWKIWSNQLKISGFLTWLKGVLNFNLDYPGLVTKINLKGKIDTLAKWFDIHLLANADKIDIAGIAPLLLEKTSGQLKSNVRLFGQWANPNLVGFLNIKDGHINFIGDENHPIENIQINVVLNEKGIYEKLLDNGQKFNFSHSITAKADYNQGKIVLLGNLNFKHWLVSEFYSTIATSKRIYVDIKTDLIQYQGYVSTGPAKSSFLKKAGTIDTKRHYIVFFGTSKEKIARGKVYLNSGKLSYIGKKQIKQKVESDFFTSINLDTIDIIFENDVIVNIGQGRLSIGEVLIKGGSTISLSKKRNNREIERFVLTGEVQAKKGSFDYLGNTFKVTRATITFTEGQPAAIELEARTKVRDEENRLVDIFLKIKTDTNNLNDEKLLFNSLSSSPSKSSEEIALLLGISEGEKEKDLSGDTSTNAGVGKSADAALNLALVKPIERKLREFFGIDTFNIRQKFIQNIVRNSQDGSGGTNEGRNPVQDTEIIIGKYIFDDVYLFGGVMLLQDTDRKSEVEEVWKVGIEIDILPFLGVESETVKLQLGAEYQRNQNEIDTDERDKAIIQLKINIEF